ncbi:phosphatase [Halanaerobium salsuginis]|uniref:Exopolyphosphatase / guanosine-5'-triphosphate,3'-diphosphate pyrophosphatase n=1 Tax=Halanaerobium salsuginis TaxID=29563 RepID=A0A1I4KSB8_9FIRM|nr:phosphatase [Halanaerobium salsuginis]SFL81640.1 exopolyphosphatase / guanosine-5'-triphosphate,3'-diphosphate pyrophosphatase [Halanaerobium salsuginis]
MKAAAIDLGTNSCRLLIGSKVNSEIEILKRELRITRLGEGVDAAKTLNSSAVNRVMMALTEYKKIIDQFEVEQVKVVGTSALRDVNNSALLSEKIAGLGWQLNIISGNQEAELNYLGAAGNLKDDFLLLDIGGGSTEFIWSAAGKLKFESLDIGCVRLTEKFIDDPAVPIKQAELNAINNYVFNLLKAELELKGNFAIKGVGGTITTLAAIKNQLNNYRSEEIENTVLELSELKKMLIKLGSVELSYRQQIAGLQPKRADIIIAGIIILLNILKFIDDNKLTVSDHDLLYGILQTELLE